MGFRFILSIALASVGFATGFAGTASAAVAGQETVAVASQTSAKAKALSELRRIAAQVHRAANEMVEGEATLLESLRFHFALGEFRHAIRQARQLGLNSAAKTYEAMLAREMDRVAFARFVRQATEYGKRVAENAQKSNPRLTPGQLRQIEANASAWYGNRTVQNDLLTSAKKVGKKTYELKVKLKPGEDLDAAAYKVYRGLSVGARKTTSSSRKVCTDCPTLRAA